MPAMHMQYTVVLLLACASGALGSQPCSAENKAVQTLLQSQARAMGNDCEDMCRNIGAYPNDGFVGCVKENTKVSALQWSTVMKKVNHGLGSLVQTLRMAKKSSSSAPTTCGAQE